MPSPAPLLCYVADREPFEYTLSIVSGKWRLKVLYMLACRETARYGEMKRSIEGVTHKMLTATLKELENESIVARREYPQVPPKVEYSLTAKGKSLLPLLQQMRDWGLEHRSAEEAGR